MDEKEINMKVEFETEDIGTFMYILDVAANSFANFGDKYELNYIIDLINQIKKNYENYI